jgi:hypothetical protein
MAATPTEAPATDRYRIVVEEPTAAKRWLRGFGTLIANVAGWFEGLVTGPTNPGGRTVQIVDDRTGETVFEFVEEFGDDARMALATIQHDLDTKTVAEFEAAWLSPSASDTSS